MIRQLIKTRRRQIIIDVNTQKDFFLDDGKTRVGNRRRILIHIRRLMALARLKHIPVISISEVHPRNNASTAPRARKN
jgi:nicotinamidase-related amidase